MVPEKGAHKEELDERLIEARDEVLLAGERVVAQEPGDQGQAVVLTDSRIVILKAGITATGLLNGRRAGAYPLGQISAISVRKGPMGAVLQVCGEGALAATPDDRPESIVVFSGPDKVKHCEAIAAKIEEALGRPIERIEPKSETSAQSEPEPEPVPEAPKPRRSRKTVEPAPTVEMTAQAEAVESAPEPEESKEKKPRGGRVAKSLAEEMFGDMSSFEPSPVPPAPEPVIDPDPEPEPVKAAVPESEPVIEMPKVAPPPEVIENLVEPQPEPEVEPEPVPEMVAEEVPEQVEPEPEPEEEPKAELAPGFRPNPNLPKPVRKKSRGPKGALVLLGGLMVMVLMGIAITAPLRQQDVTPKVEINVNKLTNSASVLRQQYIAASSYRGNVVSAVKESDRTIAAVRAAIASGNHAAIMSALNKDASDSAWMKVSGAKVPMGLAGAKECVVAGLFIRKSAVEGAMTGSVSAAETLRKLAEADQQIAKGTSIIDRMLGDLESRMPKRSHKSK